MAAQFLAAQFLPSSRGGQNLILNNNIFWVVRKKDSKLYWRCAHPDRMCGCTAVTLNVWRVEFVGTTWSRWHGEEDKSTAVEGHIKGECAEYIPTGQALIRTQLWWLRQLVLLEQHLMLVCGRCTSSTVCGHQFTVTGWRPTQHCHSDERTLISMVSDVWLSETNAFCYGTKTTWSFLRAMTIFSIFVRRKSCWSMVHLRVVQMCSSNFTGCTAVWWDFPLAFCLLPNKQQATYKLIFEKILKRFAQLNLVLQPTRSSWTSRWHVSMLSVVSFQTAHCRVVCFISTSVCNVKFKVRRLGLVSQTKWW